MLRGLAVVMPPLLTIALFFWVWNVVETKLLEPAEAFAGWAVTSLFLEPPKNEVPKPPKNDVPTGEGPYDYRVLRDPDSGQVVSFLDEDSGLVFRSVSDGLWIPETYYELVKQNPGQVQLAAATHKEVYARYVRVLWLPRWRTIPVFLFVFVSVLYLFGKFLAAGVGRMVWNGVEAMFQSIPVIRNVYSSVKQVTDFFLSERDFGEFNRVVAVQYPRKGIWSVGFVTGESMLDIRSAANQPVLSVLMPTSPMPATGFTVTVLKSETIDLNITVDQAIQFVVSCGVVVPAAQMQQNSEIGARIATSVAQRLQSPSPTSDRNGPPRGITGEAAHTRPADASPADRSPADTRQADSRQADSSPAERQTEEKDDA